jgi:hypothetical protein
MSIWTGGDGRGDDAGGVPLRDSDDGNQIETKEGEIMRYVVTTLLVLGLGVTAMAPVASAQVNVPPNNTFTNQYGNTVYPLEPGGGGGGGGCYMDGVAYSCTQPAPMTMPTPPASGGGVAGGSLVCPMFGPCYEPQYGIAGGNEPQNYNPFYGGDRN